MWRWCAVAAALSLAHQGRLRAQDTVTLSVGHPTIDGRFLRPHLAALRTTITRAGVVIASRSYTLDKTVTRHGGRQAFRLILRPTGTRLDGSYVETVLDLRTMALLYRELRDGSVRRVEQTLIRVHS
jgi:hypothetical protein